MQHRRSPKKLEKKLARNYVYQHSINIHSDNEISMRVYTGTSEELAGAVLAEVGADRQGRIPDYPQGLVISDARGGGFLDVFTDA